MSSLRPCPGSLRTRIGSRLRRTCVQVIAVNQDEAFIAGDRLRVDASGIELWARPLGNGDKVPTPARMGPATVFLQQSANSALSWLAYCPESSYQGYWKLSGIRPQWLSAGCSNHITSSYFDPVTRDHEGLVVRLLRIRAAH